MSEITSIPGSHNFTLLREKFNELLTEYQVLQENLLVKPNDPEDLYVYVQPGKALIGGLTRELSSATSVNLTAAVPGTQSRIVLIYLKRDGTVGTVDGSIAGSPVAPDYAEHLPLAEVTLVTGQTQILSSDIKDVRPWHGDRDAQLIDGKVIDSTAISDGYVLYYDLASDKIKYAAVSGLGGISIAWTDLTDTDSSYVGKTDYIPVCDPSGSPEKMKLTDPDTISVGKIDGYTRVQLDDRYVLESEKNEEADYEDFVRRNLIQNPNFNSWYYTMTTPYHYLPIGWVAGTGVVSLDSGGQRGYCAKIAATYEMTYYLHNDIAVYMRTREVFIQFAAKGVGYVRVTETHTGSTNTDVTVNSPGSFTEYSQKITINANTNAIKVIVHCNSGDLLLDNIHFGFQKRTPSSIFANFVRGKQLEFAYFDPTNPPDEGIEDNAPVTILKAVGTSKFHFTYTVPENFPGYCDLLLAFMVKPEDTASGVCKMNVIMEDHKGIPHTVDLTDRNLTRYINIPGTVQNYIYCGCRIELSAELMSDMSLHFAISRLAGDAEDTYDNKKVYLFGTEIIPLAKDYS